MGYGTPLGTICLAINTWPRRTTPKLASVEPGSKDAYYMLASYCFDTARKLEYVFKATRRFALEADPALAARIKHDNEEIATAGREWKAIAEATERILLRLHGEIEQDHDVFLNTVTRWADEARGEAS